MNAEQPGGPHYSALQLAWLQELGVEKPWLPAETAPRKIVAAKTSEVETLVVEALVVETLVVEPSPLLASSSRAPLEAVDTFVQPAQTPTVKPAAKPATKPAYKRAAKASEQATQGATVALAAAASDLAALNVTLSTCQACGLCRERKQAVFGQGVDQPAIMVIGEAPAEPEDRQGQPFVGRPGLLLDNMLTAIQSSRRQNTYVTNAVKCRPPGNRSPRPEELAACKPFLLREIELVKPFAILAVGRVAAKVLLETEASLQALRQVTHTLAIAELKIPLIVSEHPVRLLGTPADKAAAWQDLQLVRTVAGL